MTRAKRWPVQYAVQVACQDFVDEARSVNLSLRGLSIATTQSIRVGTQVYVRLLLPDTRSNVDYELCRVQWAAEGKIGLEASDMRTVEEHRLHRHLSCLESPGNPSVRDTSRSLPVGQPLSRTGDAMSRWRLLLMPLMTSTRSVRHWASSMRQHEADTLSVSRLPGLTRSPSNVSPANAQPRLSENRVPK